MIAALGFAVGGTACGDDDDDGGNSKCSEGCSKADTLCTFTAEEKSECLSTCNAATDDEIDAAYECIMSATDCSQASACTP